MKNKICRIPFNSLYNHEGNIYTCPFSMGKKHGNMYENKLSDIWNNQSMMEFRDSIYKGTYQFCNLKRCPYTSDYFNKTNDTIISINNFDRIEKLLKTPKSKLKEFYDIITYDEFSAIKNQELILHFKPINMYLGYDLTCNLKCPTCRNDYISQNQEKDKFDSAIKNLYPFADIIYLGIACEPFASNHFRNWMFTVTSEELKYVRKIYIQTNALLLNAEMWNQVSDAFKEKEILISISIDAADKNTYENMNRLGGDWDKLIENIEFISKCDDFNYRNMNFVTQLNNYLQMKDFIILARKYKFTTLFQKIGDWGTFTPKEYFARNIFFKNHPQHANFLETMKDPFFIADDIHIHFLGKLEDDEILIENVYGFDIFNHQLYKEGTTLRKGEAAFFCWTKVNLEDDYYDKVDGIATKKLIVSSDNVMGGGFSLIKEVNLTPYKYMVIKLKSNYDSMNNFKIGMKDRFGKESWVSVVDYGFQTDGNWYSLKISLQDFQIDLTNVISTFMFSNNKTKEFDSISINSLHLAGDHSKCCQDSFRH